MAKMSEVVAARVRLKTLIKTDLHDFICIEGKSAYDLHLSVSINEDWEAFDIPSEVDGVRITTRLKGEEPVLEHGP